MLDGLFDDLLGGPDKVEPVEEIEPAPVGVLFSLKNADAHQVQRGVTVPWLCQAFGLGKANVVSKLAECPAIRTVQNGAKVYDLRIAAAYLIKPRTDIHTYIQKMRPEELPEKLKREFWAARLAEQRWRRQAGELWASEDVIAVFGEVFKLIKTKTQLWSEAIDEIEMLTDPQREKIMELVDELLGQIFKSLEELESGSATLAQIGEVEDEDEADD